MTIIFVRGLQKKVDALIKKCGSLFYLREYLQRSHPFSFHSLKLGHASRTASFEKISLVISAVITIVFL